MPQRVLRVARCACKEHTNQCDELRLVRHVLQVCMQIPYDLPNAHLVLQIPSLVMPVHHRVRFAEMGLFLDLALLPVSPLDDE